MEQRADASPKFGAVFQLSPAKVHDFVSDCAFDVVGMFRIPKVLWIGINGCQPEELVVIATLGLIVISPSVPEKPLPGGNLLPRLSPPLDLAGAYFE
jgi:hypothetical protein